MTIQHRDPVPIFYVETTDIPEGIPSTFHTLEAQIASLKGRKMYGAFWSGEPNRYWACTEGVADDAFTSPVESGVLPGGAYASQKINDYLDIPDISQRIIQGFDALGQAYTQDESRPSLEFYRSQRELILLFPIHETP